MAKRVWTVLVVLVCLASAAPSSWAYTLEMVKQRGELLCGVDSGLPGFSNVDENGKWTGLYVDVCRAVSAAVLGDAAKAKFVPLTEKNRVTALLAGKVDLLSMDLPWTLTRDTALGISFAGVTYHDGQGFLVRRKGGKTSALELNESAICLQVGKGANESNLTGYFNQHNMVFKLIGSENAEQPLQDFLSGRCQVLSGARSDLYMIRQTLDPPGEYEVLPETISREPIGPIIRQGDDAWFNVIRWTVFALTIAEEKGVTAAQADSMGDSDDPEVRQLLGLEGTRGKGLGLATDWARQVIKQVGNYGELFDRNVGSQSPLQAERGLNALWNRGGIMYAPAME